MPREVDAYLDDILCAIEEIFAFTAGLTSVEDLRSDTRTRRAVERDLEVIGEAVKKIPETMRAQRPNVEWHKIAGLRDILAHAYFVIDDAILWDVIENKLRPLAAEVRALRDRNQ